MLRRNHALAAVGLTVLAAGAPAVTLNYGFEAPDYSLGSTLTGSNGWIPITAPFNAGVIQSDIVRSGSQAVKFMHETNGPANYGALQEYEGIPVNAANPIVTVEWDMYALDGSVRSDIWGVSAMWSVHNERFTVGINQNNRLTVRNGTIGTVQTNVALNRNQWYHYRVDYNYVLDMAAVYVDNAFVGEWRMDAGPDVHYGTAFFNRSFGSNDGAVFDGLSVQSSAPVPEPASLGALAIGAVALLRRRRNRS